ncbi:3-ketosteroid-delta-1-dehydrogenase [Mesobacillus subterraneus]|uniref:3-ketosteroid-delta-1-dehydrogenase n=1 Tax=Mesobacillus subterraneus TaxID=285983 RepID=A0A3R9ED41_9BACI|nr:3-ketosteroid-delta-1-dehydrogenase [Mesobacillus subterraneus]RSD27629.1 3-ketosteroid-delta-1-dehydrogenase [Mesobacillus subterraneus]
MEEERRSIQGYEELYDITRSGKIIIKKNNRARHREGNEYGYANVHLNKNGGRTLYKTFDIWKKAFPDANVSEYKGKK